VPAILAVNSAVADAVGLEGVAAGALELGAVEVADTDWTGGPEVAAGVP
jgi:hypothetical protein